MSRAVPLCLDVHAGLSTFSCEGAAAGTESQITAGAQVTLKIQRMYIVTFIHTVT